MSKANPVIIGAFVVGGLVLAIAGVIVFGSGRLFSNTMTFVLYFPGTVDGLAVGAPVKLKGVEIGSVTDIRLRFGAAQVGELTREEVVQGIRIPVIIEIDRDKLYSEGVGLRDMSNPEQLRQLIDLGLRAQLNTQSLVTGLLFIQLSFQPDQPPVLVLPPGSLPPEIPTIPTSLAQLQAELQSVVQKLQEMHFDELVKSAIATFDGITKLVQEPGLQRTIAGLPDTLTNLNETLTGVRELAAGAETLTSADGRLAIDASTALGELTNAARSIRLLADSLEKNPSAIVRGRAVKE